jgi:hypothetical protein
MLCCAVLSSAKTMMTDGLMASPLTCCVADCSLLIRPSPCVVSYYVLLSSALRNVMSPSVILMVTCLLLIHSLLVLCYKLLSSVMRSVVLCYLM